MTPPANDSKTPCLGRSEEVSCIKNTPVELLEKASHLQQSESMSGHVVLVYRRQSRGRQQRRLQRRGMMPVIWRRRKTLGV